MSLTNIFSFDPARRMLGRHRRPIVFFAISVAVCFTSCDQIRKPDSTPFYAEPMPPTRQELRWTNGGVPKSLDPAMAVAPPEADIVRSVFEGLTDLDPKTLNELPAAAEKWTSSADQKVWTFYLRKGLKWSDGSPVTASDFVRGWRRLFTEQHYSMNSVLLQNFVPPRDERTAGASGRSEIPEIVSKNSNISLVPYPAELPERPNSRPSVSQLSNTDATSPPASSAPTPVISEKERPIGFEAVSGSILKVTLKRPDPDFPKLVANPIFRPVSAIDAQTGFEGLRPDVLTNGAFKITDIGPQGVTLEKADLYWDRDSVRLESVRFVPVPTAEAALQAYRSGDVDVVTNAEFEPLALKLLAPYDDFRHTTHNALNMYEFNLAQPPYTDRRVREALTIGIERERLTEGEMKGSTEPALHLLPFEKSPDSKIAQDAQKARSLLVSAGFPNGENFPVIRLVINRNDLQQRIARSVARMWKQDLNIDCEVIVREQSEVEKMRDSGDFDLVRRGLVFSTPDRNANLAALFMRERSGNSDMAKVEGDPLGVSPIPDKVPLQPQKPGLIPHVSGTNDTAAVETAFEDAIYEFRLIPLYFPMSYSLVKPYVSGFDVNGLDAPALKNVFIDSQWQRTGTADESN